MAGVLSTVPVPGGVKHTWTGVGKSEAGEAQDVDGQTAFSKGVAVHRPNISVAVFGTFDTVTATIEGSYDGGVTWIPLKDINGAAVSFTANGVAQIGTVPEKIRYSVGAGGAGTTSLTIVILIRTPYHA